MTEPGIDIRVVDRANGDTVQHTLQPGGYVVICANPAYVASEQVHTNGTRIVVVKRRVVQGPVYVNPRGACPVCGTERALKPGGVLVNHNSERRRWAPECRGSRKPPRSETPAAPNASLPSTSDTTTGDNLA